MTVATAMPCLRAVLIRPFDATGSPGASRRPLTPAVISSCSAALYWDGVKVFVPVMVRSTLFFAAAAFAPSSAATQYGSAISGTTKAILSLVEDDALPPEDAEFDVPLEQAPRTTAASRTQSMRACFLNLMSDPSNLQFLFGTDRSPGAQPSAAERDRSLRLAAAKYQALPWLSRSMATARTTSAPWAITCP